MPPFVDELNSFWKSVGQYRRNKVRCAKLWDTKWMYPEQIDSFFWYHNRTNVGTIGEFFKVTEDEGQSQSH